jgi:hypothetical protein
MRRIVLAVLSAILVLAGSAGVAGATATQSGGGTLVNVQDPPTVVRQVGTLTYLRWTEEITFSGTIDGTSACTVNALQSQTALSFVSWCRFTGSVDGSTVGTAEGPAVGRITFPPEFSLRVSFFLVGDAGGLSGLRLVGEAGAGGAYTVSYRLGG